MTVSNQEEILAFLAETIADIAGIPKEDVQENSSYGDDLDCDSLSLVEVIVSAEEHFGVPIPEEDAVDFKTVGDTVRYIQLRVS